MTSKTFYPALRKVLGEEDLCAVAETRSIGARGCGAAKLLSLRLQARPNEQGRYIRAHMPWRQPDNAWNRAIKQRMMAQLAARARGRRWPRSWRGRPPPT